MIAIDNAQPALRRFASREQANANRYLQPSGQQAGAAHDQILTVFCRINLVLSRSVQVLEVTVRDEVTALMRHQRMRSACARESNAKP